MSPEQVCITYGMLVSGAVSFLKRFPALARYPKMVAFVLTLLGSYLMVNPTPGYAFPIAELVQCVLIQFGSAVATYEVISRPIKDSIR